MVELTLSIAPFFADGPSGKDIGDAFKAVSELPAAYAAAGVLGAVVGLAAGSGISSYCSDKGWGDPSAFGFLYYGLCSTIGAVFVIFLSTSF